MSLSRHRELLVLSTLRAHPMHGYALVEVLEAGLGGALGLKRPAVYAILKRMHERGWLEAETLPAGNHPARSVYRVTPAGVSALPALVEDCTEDPALPITPLPAVLAHLELLEEPEQRSVLERARNPRRRALQRLESLGAHPGLTGRALELMARHLRVELDLLDELLEPGSG